MTSSMGSQSGLPRLEVLPVNSEWPTFTAPLKSWDLRRDPWLDPISRRCWVDVPRAKEEAA